MLTFKLPKNVARFRASLFKTIFLFSVIIMTVSLKFNPISWFFSLALGLSFGYLAFCQLANSQAMILNTKNKNLAFPHLFMRLGLFALPLVIAQFFSGLFDLVIVVGSLLMFQYSYIILEVVYNYRKNKS